MKGKIPKVMLVAGGTGGHLFPAIALSEELKSKQCEVVLVTDQRCSKFLPQNLPIKYFIVKIYINLKGIKNFNNSLWQIITALFYSIKLLRSEKPKLIIGFGGYTSFPTLLIARFMNIPMIIFEANSFMGRVNLFFAKYAKKIISPNEITNLPENCQNKFILSPLLIRQEIKKNKGSYKANSKIFHLLIVGGSQGASFFDQLIPEAIEKLLNKNPEIKIKVTQQVQKNNIKNIQNTYNDLNVEHNISDFFSNMSEIYKSSQLMISRSGASSISEITYLNIPAIYVPYPHAKDDHQYFNAKIAESKNYAWCFTQDSINAMQLSNLLDDLIQSPKILQDMSDKMKGYNSEIDIQDLRNTVYNLIKQ